MSAFKNAIRDLKDAFKIPSNDTEKVLFLYLGEDNSPPISHVALPMVETDEGFDSDPDLSAAFIDQIPDGIQTGQFFQTKGRYTGNFGAEFKVTGKSIIRTDLRTIPADQLPVIDVATNILNPEPEEYHFTK